jgi:hypothetical protein
MSRVPEKRAAQRVSYLCDVECEGAGARFRTRINDLSTDGAFIDSVTNFPQGSIVKLRFRIGDKAITVNSEVRYCMPQIGMGVRFTDLSADDRAAIARVISDQA